MRQPFDAGYAQNFAVGRLTRIFRLMRIFRCIFFGGVGLSSEKFRMPHVRRFFLADLISVGARRVVIVQKGVVNSDFPATE